MILYDEEAIENQKGILGEVLKKAAWLLIWGEGLVKMSLPVRIFEPKSNL